MSFYRPEVFENKKSNIWGEVLVAPTRFYLKAIGVLCLVSIIAVILLCSSHYFRKETVTGVIEPNQGIVSLYAPQSGYVSEMTVSQGDMVIKDKILLKISDHPKTHSGENYDESFKRLLQEDARIIEDKVAILDENNKLKISEVNLEIQNLKSSITNAQEQKELALVTAQQLSNRLADLNVAYEKGAISSVQMRTFESEARHKEQEVLALEEKLISYNARIEQLILRKKDIAQTTQEQKVALMQQKTDIQKKIIDFDRREGVSVYSPSMMKITQLNVKTGQYIQSGTHLLDLEHSKDSYIGILRIPEQSIGFVEEGMTVNFRLHAYPYEHYGILSGTISHIGRSAVFDPNSGQYFYRATVTLDKQSIYGHGKDYKLRHGLAFDADIKTQKLTLIDKILEPLRRMKKI